MSTTFPLTQDVPISEAAPPPPVFIVPGANPSPRKPEATRNLIIVPTDADQKTVRLDRAFRDRINLSDLAPQSTKSIAPGPNYTVIERPNRSSVALIVTSGGADAISASLSDLLNFSPHIARLLPQLERIWIPLLGIEASNLTREQSLQAILAGIALAASGLSRIRRETETPCRFIIATSAEIDPASLTGLRSITEAWAGRSPVDMAGALRNLNLPLDHEAESILDRAARLALAQRPPMDNGEVGSRSLLFAFGDPSSLRLIGDAFAQTLTELAGPQFRQAQSFYFRDDLSELLRHPAPPPVRLDQDLTAILQDAAPANPGQPIGTRAIARALLDRCQSSDPRPTFPAGHWKEWGSARRA
jgi:hypothetical protein